jgi:hypothetical protein
MYLGDFWKGDTVNYAWNTFDTNNASVTRATDGTVQAYENASTTQTTGGITDTEDFDGLTGVHHVAVDTSNAAYSAGNDYIVAVSGATVDGQTVNARLFSFSIENRSSKKDIVLNRGTAQAGTVSTIQLASGAVTADDEFNTYTVWIHSGTGAGQMRIIDASVASNDTLTVEPNWATTPDATSEYRVLLHPPISTVDLPTVDGSGNVTLTDTSRNAVWTTAQTESYAGDNANPTPIEAIYMILQRLVSATQSGNTITVRQRDDSATAFSILLDDGADPTTMEQTP